MPCAFGVLTVENMEQALARAGRRQARPGPREAARGASLRDGRALRAGACSRPRLDCAAMAKVCHSCGKGPAFGNSRSHSMVATKRRFDPNLQKVRITIGGAPRARVRVHALPEGRQGHQGGLSAAGRARRRPPCRAPASDALDVSR